MRKTPFLLFLALALLLASILLRPALPTSGEVTPTDLPALTLAPMQGNATWNQQKILTGHLTLINFFASWCAPCAAEMPELNKLKKQFPNLQLIGVAWNDEVGNMQTFLKKSGNPFGSVWFDSKGDSTIALGIKGIPESFILDEQGKIRARISGPLTVEEVGNYLDKIAPQPEMPHAS